ncbi:hypothetical protein S7S_11130 [Isoalcanivorax pacificus W11-5]|uniref:3D (Asp-Asp-Asp) domain-containing protein n=1 Tax=Isoalcanivorax pacificus W11-5 TaxID=391936 RepID=A0A0B4XQA7_9GAMM|nr:3D domain-containing protein [Isoalcanivorax pacificus]AJD48638.1 hypothetical protein S7S_11130 [Isoalcanivorax pacificus W11-5]
MRHALLTLLLTLALPGLALASQPREMTVRASAYNSLPGQGMGNPSIGAWGDHLKPGMKAIAVSRDLLESGILNHRSVVRIEGLPGEYLVLDKMHRRWERKIDIYFGEDLEAAREWGNRRVVISWD